MYRNRYAPIVLLNQYISMYVHMYVCMYVCDHKSVATCIHFCISITISMHKCVYTICMRLWFYVWASFVCVCVCIFTCLLWRFVHMNVHHDKNEELWSWYDMCMFEIASVWTRWCNSWFCQHANLLAYFLTYLHRYYHVHKLIIFLVYMCIHMWWLL